jgi:hypothetical protein
MAIVEAGNGFSQAVTADEVWNRGISLTADGQPKAKSGGVTFDWTSVVALAKDTYLYSSLDENGDPITDAVAIVAGEKVLPVGSVIIRKAGGDGEFVLAPATIDAAAEGVRGDIFLVNETVLKSDRYSAHPVAIDGGRIFKSRLMVAGANGGATTANAGTAFYGVDVDGGDVAQVAPGLAAVEAALPSILYAED